MEIQEIVMRCQHGEKEAFRELLQTVESSEETKIRVSFGPVFITDENKKDMDRKFDFKINLPEKIGSYSYEKIDNYVYGPGVVIMDEDVKYKD